MYYYYIAKSHYLIYIFHYNMRFKRKVYYDIIMYLNFFLLERFLYVVSGDNNSTIY